MSAAKLMRLAKPTECNSNRSWTHHANVALSAFPVSSAAVIFLVHDDGKEVTLSYSYNNTAVVFKSWRDLFLPRKMLEAASLFS